MGVSGLHAVPGKETHRLVLRSPFSAISVSKGSSDGSVNGAEPELCARCTETAFRWCKSV